MKKAIVLTGLIAIALLMTNCSKRTTGALATSDATYTAAVTEVKAKYTEQQMQEGMTIWQGSCGKCHKLFAPADRSVKQWEKILPRMSKKANLADEQAGKVRAYILSNATKMS